MKFLGQMQPSQDTLGGPPHPVIVAIRDNEDCIWVLLYSSSTTSTGWGVLLRDT